jgi:hypothetical protein
MFTTFDWNSEFTTHSFLFFYVGIDLILLCEIVYWFNNLFIK